MVFVISDVSSVGILCDIRIVKIRGIGEHPYKPKPVIFHGVKMGGSRQRTTTFVMLAPRSKALFGALHYWVQRAFTRLVKTKNC